MTAGEIVFDRVVYTGIGFALNEALGMLFAVEMRDFGGKEAYLKASKWWQKTLGFKNKTKNGKTITGLERAADSLEIAALLTSGTALLAPMKMMEDRKSKIVRNLNHLMDKLPGRHLDAEAVRARDEEVERGLACEPKQSWNSLILGRLIAIGHNMFFLKETVFGGLRTQKVKNWSEEYVTLATDKLHAWTGGQPDSMIGRMRNSPRFEPYAKILGLETLYTIASSVVLEVASKFIAGKKTTVKDPELCARVKQEELEPQPVANDSNFAAKTKRMERASIEQTASYAQKVADESAQQPQRTL